MCIVCIVCIVYIVCIVCIVCIMCIMYTVASNCNQSWMPYASARASSLLISTTPGLSDPSFDSNFSIEEPGRSGSSPFICNASRSSVIASVDNPILFKSSCRGRGKGEMGRRKEIVYVWSRDDVVVGRYTNGLRIDFKGGEGGKIDRG